MNSEQGQPAALDTASVIQALKGMSEGWQVDLPSQTLSIRFEQKGYQKLVQLANLAAWLASDEGHHPDIRFGWGFCEILLTTHDASGLSERDFGYARRLDLMLQRDRRSATG